ncbi:MAG: penicillin-binding protein 2 [Bacteroidales bacterium]|jgi:penicillin-binding protein 2|nr:penicillin-binding protein 2 [Bacteroidales bacterium]
MRSPQIQRSSGITAIIVVVFAIFLIRLFYLQILDTSYRASADNNALRNVVQYPARGLIYDRNGQLMVYNEAVYDLMVVPGQVKNLDTAEFCALIEISIDDFRKKFDKAKTYSKYAASVFEKQISKETYGQLQERMFKFRGFYVQPRTLRKYPKPVAAHVLGYIGEVDEKMIAENPYYKSGDYIGMSGLEKFYEPYLRGRKGSKVLMVDVHNREKGSYRNGLYDTVSEAGMTMQSTLDLDVQELAELLMQNKRGSVVAIEPATGEILAFVTAPTYDPNLLVGRARSANYNKLLLDPQKPLFDRALMAEYPPGSIFKLPQGLIALQHGVINENSGFQCDKSLIGCHGHPDARNVREAVKMSCNPYFLAVFRRMIMQDKDKNRFIDSRIGLDMWNKDMYSFGFGTRMDIDLPSCRKGLIPTVSLFDRIYGENQWAYSNFRSVSIGQGEVLLVPLQMANLAAIMANRGYYVTPHLCRTLGDTLVPNPDYLQKHHTNVDPKYFEQFVLGMYDVVHEPGGTARRARMDSIAICGKTGTAQNPHGKDHAVFIAFAPMDNPKIAISVFVENSGFGGTWAAPIASLLIEKYLTRDVKRKDLMQQMLDAKFDYIIPEKP